MHFTDLTVELLEDLQTRLERLADFAGWWESEPGLETLLPDLQVVLSAVKTQLAEQMEMTR